MESQHLTWPGWARSRAHLQEHCAVDLRPPQHQDGHRASAVWRPGEAPLRLTPPAWRHQCATAWRPRRRQVAIPQVRGEGLAARRLHHRCMPFFHLGSFIPCHFQPETLSRGNDMRCKTERHGDSFAQVELFCGHLPASHRVLGAWIGGHQQDAACVQAKVQVQWV